MERFLRLSVLVLTGLGWLGSRWLPWNNVTGAETTPALAATPPYEASLVVEMYCTGCHSNGRAKIDLDGPIDLRRVRRDRPTWEKILAKLRAAEMPPKSKPQPTPEQRDHLIRWVEQGLLEESLNRRGRIVARRLSREEYRNTVRDLVGVAFEPGQDFPADDTAWDRSLAVPTLSVDLLEQYRRAADRIVDETDVSRLPVSQVPMGGQPQPDPGAAATPLEAEGAHAILSTFSRRAYRRPLEPDEGEYLDSVFDDAVSAGMDFEGALRIALKMVLASPHFLHVVDMQPDPNTDAGNADIHTQYALAARLSYFLWRGMPDEELFAQAERGDLRQDLPKQLERMLKDPRSRSLPADFAGYWLELRRFKGSSAADEALNRDMSRETETFVEFIVRADRNVLEFLDADYTFLNERLARHYGISGIQGDEMRRVSLQGTQRAGLLTQASILALPSAGGESSPTKRGKWVLDNLLGEPPAAPPSGLLEAFDDLNRDVGAGTRRLLLEQHRANPSCAHCHAKIDGIGMCLENFDGTGAWRTMVAKRPIDAFATLPEGEVLEGPVQLTAYLRGKRDMFIRCLSGKLLSYALGRKLADGDWAAMDGITKAMAGKEPRFSSLLLEVIMSPPFQRGWCEEPATVAQYTSPGYREASPTPSQ